MRGTAYKFLIFFPSPCHARVGLNESEGRKSEVLFKLMVIFFFGAANWKERYCEAGH